MKRSKIKPTRKGKEMSFIEIEAPKSETDVFLMRRDWILSTFEGVSIEAAESAVKIGYFDWDKISLIQRLLNKGV